VKQRLFLITPPVDDPLAFRPALAAALSAGDVACVHLRLAAREDAQVKRHVQVLAETIQQHGAALIIDAPADTRLVARAGADGAQLDFDAAKLADVVSELKPDRIVGVANLRSRDDAMTAGEADVDYLIFGEPRPDGWMPPLEQVLERCRWWAELFTVPCVGCAPTLADVPAVAETGVDFVALGEAVWSHAEGPAVAVRAAQAVVDAENKRAAERAAAEQKARKGGKSRASGTTASPRETR
jgi:thiamine-phosphate pyrophosphorylase